MYNADRKELVEYLDLAQDKQMLASANKAVYGVCLKTKEHVVATHNELHALRKCSEVLRSKPGHRLHIISPAKKDQTDYLVTTLQHLGVSCGEINLIYRDNDAKSSSGIWLFVAR